MRKLVALDLPGGDLFRFLTEKCFENGDAILPLDTRLSKHAKQRIIKLLRPNYIITPTGNSVEASSRSENILDRYVITGKTGVLRDFETVALKDGVGTEDGDGVVIPTSGTTGTPKGVVIGIDALLASAQATNRYLKTNPGQDKWLCCLPVSHIGGLSIITRGILTGTEVVAIAKFDKETIVGLIKEEKVNLTSLVPTTLDRLGNTYADQFRKILLGGSKLPDNTPSNVIKTYGMTETASGVVYDGNILDGMELAFRSIDKANSVIDRSLKEGEICLRGAMLFKNYRFANETSKLDGWFPTGDAGKLDQCGKLIVDGRIAELIITGGEKVWPSHVEKVILKTKGIAEAVVAGMEDKIWGQKVVAFLVKHETGEKVDIASLKESIKDEIGPWAVPKSLYLVNQIPKTAIGKPIKSQLTAYALEGRIPLIDKDRSLGTGFSVQD